MTLGSAWWPFNAGQLGKRVFLGGNAASKKTARKLAPLFVANQPSHSMQRDQLPKIAHQLFFLVGLAEIGVDAELLGAVAMLFGGARRDHDDRDLRKVDVCLDGLREFEPVHPRHLD